ncbi:DUF6879 family protein [Kribbella sp. NPDC056951]|uniref:DUF6879 family protein n=1 Tax=Kribbella sp. NPDC056951 TaxID=3345978 RepID=UPI003641F137
MNYEEFDAHFDRFTTEVFRLENLQRYSVSGEEEEFAAFRRGDPLPERSVRTSPWLARIAVTTIGGKRWERVHVVDHPLSEYLRYELVGYVENQVAGEQIGIADRAADASLSALGEDFWLFDSESPDAYAVLMHYDEAGHFVGFDHTVDPAVLDRCRQERDIARQHAVGLNTYLAERKADVVPE